MHRSPVPAPVDPGSPSADVLPGRVAFFVLLLTILGVLAASCAPGEPVAGPTPEEEPAVEDPAEEPEERVRAPRYRPYLQPFPLFELPVAPAEAWAEAPADGWAEAVLSTMTLRQKVGQMIMPVVLGDFAPEGSASHRRITRMIDEHEIGGVIMSIGTPTEVATKLNVLQRRSRLPLLVAADLETGAGFRFRGAIQTPGGQDLGGATDFPPLMALGSAGQPALAYEMGRITALEARAVGIHVPFAPVLDVNNNPENPIINTRAFGEDPDQVGRLGACFIQGVQDHGALATGKHFPGHGDTGVDSHLDLPVIQVGRDRMERVELAPFRKAVDTGIAAIMTAHIALPSMTEERRLPATLSRRVLTDLLRDEMGFDGLVFTDAMDMNAIDRLYSREEAAARAVEAGADIILMPPDVEAAVRGIVNAVRSGRVPEERIDESALRVLRAKAELGLHRERTVDVEDVHRTVGVAAHTRIAEEAAVRSLTLLRNRGGLLPLAGRASADVLSVTYRRANDLLAGRYFNGELRRTYRGLQTAALTAGSPEESYDRLLERARSSNLVVVSTYVSAVAYAGSVAVPDRLVEFVQDLAREGVPHVVVSFGNPYLIEEFPDARSYLLAWGGAEVSQRAAARALLGRVPVRGRSPIRIPPSFEIGAGIPLGAPPAPVVARHRDLDPDSDSGSESNPGARGC